MYRRIGVGDVAGSLILETRRVGVRELTGIFIARLYLHRIPVEGAPIHAGWGAGLHSTRLEAQLHELLRDARRRPLGSATTPKLLFADMDEAVQESTIGKDDRVALDLHT